MHAPRIFPREGATVNADWVSSPICSSLHTLRSLADLHDFMFSRLRHGSGGFCQERLQNCEVSWRRVPTKGVRQFMRNKETRPATALSAPEHTDPPKMSGGTNLAAKSFSFPVMCMFLLAAVILSHAPRGIGTWRTGHLVASPQRHRCSAISLPVPCRHVLLHRSRFVVDQFRVVIGRGISPRVQSHGLKGHAHGLFRSHDCNFCGCLLSIMPSGCRLQRRRHRYVGRNLSCGCVTRSPSTAVRMGLLDRSAADTGSLSGNGKGALAAASTIPRLDQPAWIVDLRNGEFWW